MKEVRTLGFVGGGRVTRIILEGFRRKGTAFERVVVGDPDTQALARLAERFPDIHTTGENKNPAAEDFVFVALHPPVLKDAVSSLLPFLKADSVLVSLAPKITIESISGVLGGFGRIARMIPNAPSVINIGYNPISFSAVFKEEEKSAIRRMLGALGDCPEVPEGHLEAYAIVAAMGPTYFWFQWLQLGELGERFGLSREEAWKAVLAMSDGAVKTLFASGLDPEDVLDLIPVRPLKDDEEEIRARYRVRLEPLYQKIKP